MERKVGEVFTYNGKTYQVVKSDTCMECVFKERVCSILKLRIGPCTTGTRSDKTDVVFKEINNNMEIKNNQLTINIPEGMEIDLENSDLAKGIIKFRNKWLTIEEIYNLRPIVACEYLSPTITVSAPTRKKIIAISELMDIARYFNSDWKYNPNGKENGYCIAYYANEKEPHYEVRTIVPDINVYYGIVVFKNKSDAQYVIDNPNFRDILDAIYKN